MKQTAVEWFLTEFQKQVWFEPNSELNIWIKDLIPKAKEMEKEQIFDAYNTSFLLRDKPYSTAEKYYNKTFNKSIKNKG
jgi:hypothetical protein